MNRVYYLKKQHSIFPGAARPVSARFLEEYYEARRRQRGAARAALDAAVAAGFRAWIPRRARTVARKFDLGPDWADWAIPVALRRFADPQDLAMFRVAETGEAEMDYVMRRFEYSGVSKLINPAAWRPDCALVDKAAFHERCAAAGLPVSPLLARVRGKSATVLSAPAGGPVAVKPADGEGGGGFALLDYAAPAQGPDAEHFARFLTGALDPRAGVWLAQPRLRNHRDMADLTLDALATVRATTMLNADGAPEIVTSVLRFASQPGAAIDNVKSGALMAPVDAQSGTLGIACYGRRAGDFSEHPASGAPIAGRVLPDWAAACDLIRRAHAGTFGEYSMIGWDVALTPEGPLLIEGNGKPSLLIAQRGPRMAVGRTRLGALLQHHIALNLGAEAIGAERGLSAAAR